MPYLGQCITPKHSNSQKALNISFVGFFNLFTSYEFGVVVLVLISQK